MEHGEMHLRRALMRGHSRKGKGRGKVRKVLHEFKSGKLRSGSGAKVNSRDQALAIALSEAGLSRRRS